MTRIEQRVCDRCFRKDEGFEDHGWNELEVNDADFDVCPSCSRDLVSWIGAGVSAVGAAAPGTIGAATQSQRARELSQLHQEQMSSP